MPMDEDHTERHSHLVQDTERRIKSSRQGKLNLTLLVLGVGVAILLLLLTLTPAEF